MATTSIWQQDKTAEWRIHQIVDAYGRVRDSLVKHEPGYPTHEYIKARIKKGVPKFGMKGVGRDQDSDGSEWLIQIMELQDNRPVWILAWGGVNVLAQALWKIQQTKTPEEVNRLVGKMRVYTISDQDDSGPWIRKNFPGLFYIVSPGYEENGRGGYHFATWSGIYGDKFHGRFQGADFSLVDNPWLDQNIRQNHGPLGAEHPHTEYLMEGDSPSFLYLISNGLGDPEHPNYGSWGGRYELYIPRTQKWFYQPETRPIWTDAVDEVLSGVDNQSHTSNHATIWRWREAYQHDFAARMDWTLMDFDQANHPPVVSLGHPNEFSVKAGETVQLSAAGSTDPDMDDLSYNWIYYREVGTLNNYWLKVEHAGEKEASFKAPPVDSAQTAHFILEVIDNGEPPLTRYQRVIITILPN